MCSLGLLCNVHLGRSAESGTAKQTEQSPTPGVRYLRPERTRTIDVGSINQGLKCDIIEHISGVFVRAFM